MTAPPPKGWSLAEAAAHWFPELWALASDTTFSEIPGAREAWIARCRTDPDHPVGRILESLPHEVAVDTLAWLDAQVAYPTLRPPPLDRETLRALTRADDRLNLEWFERVRRAEAARLELGRRFCARMAAGEAVAYGVAAARPLAGEVVIPASAWRAAWPVFGYEAETIAGFGDHPAGCVLFGDGRERVLSVRIVEAARAGAAPPAKSPRPGIEAARAWMREHVPAARAKWKMAFAIDACQRATGCTRAEARRAWTELPPEVRRPPR